MVVLNNCLVVAGARNNGKIARMLMQKGAKLGSATMDAATMNGGCLDLIMLAAEAGQDLDFALFSGTKNKQIAVFTRLMELDVAVDSIETALTVLLYRDCNIEVDDESMQHNGMMLTTSFFTYCLHYGGLDLASHLALITNRLQDKHMALTHNIDDIVFSFIAMGAFERLPYTTGFLNYSNDDFSLCGDDDVFTFTRHRYDRLISQIFADLLILNQYDVIFAMLQACPSLQNVCVVHAEAVRNDYTEFIGRVAISCGVNVDTAWIRNNSAMIMIACSQLALGAIGLIVAVKTICQLSFQTINRM